MTNNANNNGVVGSAEIITFRTHRNEHPYFESILALIRGSSVGHMAMRLIFKQKDLFLKYVAGNEYIPHFIHTDSKTGIEFYEVYLSFWPPGRWSPTNNSSMLQNYHFDCEQSAGYSPIEYSPRFEDYLSPQKRVIKSSLPIIGALFKSQITLPPTMILHSTRLAAAYGDAIRQQAEIYAQRYHAWRVAVIQEQNTHRAGLLLKSSECKLKAAMFPGQELKREQFMHLLLPFVTYGYNERDVVKLPLLHNSHLAGVNLEPVLQYIAKLANYPKLHPYNVFQNNCANQVINSLWHGTKDSAYATVRAAFLLPWYIRWFKLTVTPTFIIQFIVKIQKLIEKINNYRLHLQPTDKAMQIAADNIAKPEPSSPKAEPVNHFADLDLRPTLEFSGKTNPANDDETSVKHRLTPQHTLL